MTKLITSRESRKLADAIYWSGVGLVHLVGIVVWLAN
jgi:hypothetical protein